MGERGKTERGEKNGVVDGKERGRRQCECGRENGGGG